MESTPIREDTLGELFAKSKLRLESEGKVGTIYRLQAPPHLNGTVAGERSAAPYFSPLTPDLAPQPSRRLWSAPPLTTT